MCVYLDGLTKHVADEDDDGGASSGGKKRKAKSERCTIKMLVDAWKGRDKVVRFIFSRCLMLRLENEGVVVI
jgi:hypothetical protein